MLYEDPSLAFYCVYVLTICQAQSIEDLKYLEREALSIQKGFIKIT
jgi:hypothetical protein